jgi:hypothetical protein
MADIFLSYGGADFLVEEFEESRATGSDSDFDYRLDAILA